MGLFADEDTYNDEILAAAVATKIPVSSLKGIMAMESQFDPNAYRDEPDIQDGSRGLMQILYKTAKGVGFDGDPDDLFDPATGALFGAKFFAQLVARYPNYLDAVASYNMGSPRAAGNTTPTIVGIYGQPGPDWTYANQPYVDRVAAYTAYYQAVENNDAAKAATVLDLIKKKIIRRAALSLEPPLSGRTPLFNNPPSGWEV